MMSRMVWVLALTGALGASAGAQQGDGVYQPPSREPTAEETAILELMNRFRANPKAEGDLIAPPGRNDLGVDWKMFHDEVNALKPMPPLVFNLDLLDAARKHSYYMIRNELGHVETPGRPGFYGAQPGDRITASGYKGGAGWGENAYRDSSGPWGSHSGFIIDNGPGGPGGMQPGRGHRKNMIGNFKEVGPGAVPHGKDRLSVTHDFAGRDARFAGGVVYIDLNGNEFYDVGEGLGGVSISGSDGTSVLTWKAGSYVIMLKGQGAVTLSAAIDGEKHTKAFPAGGDNVEFDWAVPVSVPLKKADRYLAAVEKAGEPGTPKHTAALINLAYGTRDLYLDAERKAKVKELAADVAAELEGVQKSVLEAIAADVAGLQKFLDEQQKPYRGTEADAWFQDAETLAKLKRGVATFVKNPNVSDRDRKAMAQMLEDTGKKMKTFAFRADVDALVSKVRG
jgi:uncharacterized protein YkwD